jgi:tetratricopeptide (TPR) repeat protein
MVERLRQRRNILIRGTLVKSLAHGKLARPTRDEIRTMRHLPAIEPNTTRICREVFAEGRNARSGAAPGAGQGGLGKAIAMIPRCSCRPMLGAALALVMSATLAADAAALIRAGEAKLKLGEMDAGLALLRQAAQTDPGSSLARTRVGGALLLKREYRAAIAEFRAAIALDASNADAFVGMAVAYLHGGDYPLARAALEEAKRLDPTKAVEIDALIAYIDERAAGVGAPGPTH